MAIAPAAISASPAVTMMAVDSTAPERPAASANGTVRPSAIPMTTSRTVSVAVKWRSWCGVDGNQGTAGHVAGAGVRRAPENLSTLSVFAVDGGLPVALAGVSAHQRSPVPIVRRTAIRPCDGSFNVYAHPDLPPRTRIWFDL